MNLQTFYDQTDEHGVSNRDKLSQRQRIIRRVDTTAKDKSFEAAEGRHDGVVIVDGKLIADWLRYPHLQRRHLSPAEL